VQSRVPTSVVSVLEQALASRPSRPTGSKATGVRVDEFLGVPRQGFCKRSVVASVAFQLRCVEAPPPKNTLNGVLQSTKRAARGFKLMRIAERLATLQPLSQGHRASSSGGEVAAFQALAARAVSARLH